MRQDGLRGRVAGIRLFALRAAFCAGLGYIVVPCSSAMAGEEALLQALTVKFGYTDCDELDRDKRLSIVIEKSGRRIAHVDYIDLGVYYDDPDKVLRLHPANGIKKENYRGSVTHLQLIPAGRLCSSVVVEARFADGGRVTSFANPDEHLEDSVDIRIVNR